MPTRYLIGLLLIAIGAGYIAGEITGHAFGPIFAQWWPVIIVAIGINQLFRHPTRPWGAIIVTALGFLILARTLDILPSNFWPIVGALILVLFGLWLVLPKRARRSHVGSAVPVHAKDRVDESALFGAMHVYSESPQFRGGSVTATFSGVELDLRQAQLAPEGATLDLAVVFSGIEVKVPPSWPVVMTGTPLLGGCQNRARGAQVDEATQPVLRIRCSGMFGGVDVRN